MEHGWHIITYFIAPLLRFVAYTLNMSTDELEAPAMRENIETVDHLVEKCIAVFSEILLFSQSLEKKMAYPHGYDYYHLLSDRIDGLLRNTRPGKQLSKSSILLVQGVIEALLLKGPMQEKDLKEYLVMKFKTLGLKVSSRSVFGGTSLEVSSVCNILGSLGILECMNENEEISSDDFVPSETNDALRQLNEALKVKFENTPFESSNKSDSFVDVAISAPAEQTSSQKEKRKQQQVKIAQTSSGENNVPVATTDEFLDLDIVDMFMTQPSVDHANGIEDFGDHNMHSSLLEESVSMDFAASGLLSEPTNVSEAAVELSTAMGSLSSTSALNSNSTVAKKQYMVGKKMWRMRHNQSLPPHLLQLIAQSSSYFNQWMQACHGHSTALEIEEKMLRRICYDADVALPRQPFREGSRYMHNLAHKPASASATAHASNSSQKNNVHYNQNYSNSIHNASSQFERKQHFSHKNSDTNQSHSHSNTACQTQPHSLSQTSSSNNSNSGGPRRDLLDGAVKFTAEMLLDKVARSKRQLRPRSSHNNNSNNNSSSGGGNSNSNNSNCFSSSHVHELRAVAQRAAQYLAPPNTPGPLSDHHHNNSSSSLLNRNSNSSGFAEEQAKWKRQKLGASDSAMTLGEYVRHLQQSQQQYSVNAILSGLSTLNSALLLSGAHPSVTAATIRHYAPTHTLCTTYDEVFTSNINSNVNVAANNTSSNTNANGSDTAAAAITPYPIALPDLAISTVEVPWKTLVTEFSLVVLDDTGEFVDGLSNKLLSHAELSLDPQLQLNSNINSNSNDNSNTNNHTQAASQTHAAAVETPSVNKNSLKKRSRSSGQLSIEELQHDQISIHHTLKRKIISEVFAPEVKTFTLNATISSSMKDVVAANGAVEGEAMAADEDEDEAEDTSDDHYLSLHDAVLKNMRERWAMLSRLKNDVRRDGSSAAPSGGAGHATMSASALKRQRSESSANTAVNNSTMDTSLSIPAVYDDGDAFNPDTISLTPLIKKRGRPPKFQKSSSKYSSTHDD